MNSLVSTLINVNLDYHKQLQITFPVRKFLSLITIAGFEAGGGIMWVVGVPPIQNSHIDDWVQYNHAAIQS